MKKSTGMNIFRSIMAIMSTSPATIMTIMSTSPATIMTDCTADAITVTTAMKRERERKKTAAS